MAPAGEQQLAAWCVADVWARQGCLLLCGGVGGQGVSGL